MTEYDYVEQVLENSYDRDDIFLLMKRMNIIQIQIQKTDMMNGLIN